LIPNVNNPGFRAVSFGDLVDNYYDQDSALLEGAVVYKSMQSAHG